MSGSRILVVDDEPQIQRFLKPALVASDFEVLTAATAREAMRLIATRSPDLVILDLGLPDSDGKSVIAEVRAFSRVPIIVLSARDQESEKVEALDLGADDYIEKPFGIAELLARIRTALRRGTGGPGGVADTFEFSGLRVDAAARVVSRDNVPIHLTPKEYELLLQLVRNAGRVITHRQLLTSIWGVAHADDVQYLRVAIAQLRAKIEADPAHPRLILNEPAIGYRFAGE
ncbi:MAG: response regulator [Devosia nanyangense]|uniref:Response regulator n=1 Tax=Devosia nanyangense TaxID=1228055 RepID=A0A933L2C4_9HYPH|nr:response regulator [Devosia nanyangense]